MTADHLEPFEPSPPALEDLDGEYAIHGAFSAAKDGALLIDGEPVDAAIRNVVLGKGVHEFRGVIDVEIEPQ